MPNIGGPAAPRPFKVWWDDDSGERVTAEVRWSPDAVSNYLAIAGDRTYPLDELTDLLRIVPVGTIVHVDYGAVEVELRLVEGRILARASGDVNGERRTTEAQDLPERALVKLGVLSVDRAAPRMCFWCAHSDYEPGVAFGEGGQLACFLAERDAYAALATSPHARERKQATARLRFQWVDELHTCDAWTRRPPGHGYRG